MGGTALLHPIDILEAAGVRSGMRIGDFGVGRTGHFAIPASRLVGDDGVVYAVDIHPECLQMLEGHRKLGLLNNLETVWGNVERHHGVPLPPASLDLVLVINTLWQARDHLGVARELKRLLKPGARAVVIDWHPHGRHVASPPLHLRVPEHAVDMIFQGEGWRALRFSPSPWHWGRIYAS